MDRNAKNYSESKASNKTQNSKSTSSTGASNKQPNQYTKGADHKSAKNTTNKDCK